MCRLRDAFSGELNEIVPQPASNTVQVPPHDEYHFDAVLEKKHDPFTAIQPVMGQKTVVLLYGPTGTGKTTTFQQLYDAYLRTTSPTTFNAIEFYNGKRLDLASGPFTKKDVKDALQKRKVASTNVNSASSRGHLILTLDASPGASFTLVDLAGCERLTQSGDSSERRSEAISVNKSLSALRDVVEGLSSKQHTFVPWRNSPLTLHLRTVIQDKHAVCVMMLCCSRDKQMCVDTLKFGRKATKISFCAHIPQPPPPPPPPATQDYKQELDDCRKELELVKRELDRKRSVTCSQCGEPGHNKRTCVRSV